MYEVEGQTPALRRKSFRIGVLAVLVVQGLLQCCLCRPKRFSSARMVLALEKRLDPVQWVEPSDQPFGRPLGGRHGGTLVTPLFDFEGNCNCRQVGHLSHTLECRGLALELALAYWSYALWHAGNAGERVRDGLMDKLLGGTLDVPEDLSFLEVVEHLKRFVRRRLKWRTIDVWRQDDELPLAAA